MKQFHSFRLDTTNHCLWRAENRVPLTPKAFDVLRYLVENAGRLVTQNEILESLWPDTYVNPEVIKKYILGIRKVLGDRSDQPLFIETFPKRGYQFVAPVTDAAAAELPDPSSDSKKMVGRDTALTELNALLGRALNGQRQLIFVTGEPGIGKTTLVDMFHQLAAHRPNLRFTRGQSVEGFGGKEAYYPMLEALGQLVRDSESNPVAQILAKRAPTWWIQFPSLVKAEKREALQKEILGATRERMVREICEALEVIAQEHPLVLIFEDLHWADDSTLDFISAWARRRGPAKLMLLGTYRPADVVLSKSPLKGLKQDLQVHQLCTEIPLERLEESAIGEYLAAEFPESSLPAGLARLIYRHSGGNALFMVAIVQDMVKKGLIAKAGRVWTLTKPLSDVDPGVPETLQQMLEVQFDQLSAEQRRILKSASAAGEKFSVWAIAATMEIPPEEIEDICEALSVRGQFIRSAGLQELDNGTATASYEFRHSLYRQVVYRALSEVARSRFHLALGQRLLSLYTPSKPELASELALHFELGRDYEQAIEYFIVASENVIRRFAYRDAIKILQHALALAPKTPHRAMLEIQILDWIGDAYYAIGDMTASAQALETAAMRASEAGLKSEEVNVLNALSRSLVLIDADQGIGASKRALRACQEVDDPLLLARTQLLGATLRLAYDRWSKEDSEICARARQTLALLSPDSPPRPDSGRADRSALQSEYLAADAHGEGICKYYEVWDTDRQTLQGEYHAALKTAEVGVANINESSSLVAYVLAVGAKAIALMHLGQIGQALEVLRAARGRAEKNGNNAWIFMLREGWLRVLALDFHGAKRLCDEITGMNAPYMSGQPSAMGGIAAGYAALYEDDYEHAIRTFSGVVDRTSTSKFFLHWAWRMYAELGMSHALLRKGDLPGAGHQSEVFRQSALSTGDPHLQALAWEITARVAIACENWPSADHAIATGLAILRERDVPVYAWRMHGAAWEFYRLRKDPESAERHLAIAEAGIRSLASSLPESEPLRAIFLSADPVQRVLRAVAAAKTNVTPEMIS